MILVAAIIIVVGIFLTKYFLNKEIEKAFEAYVKKHENIMRNDPLYYEQFLTKTYSLIKKNKYRIYKISNNYFKVYNEKGVLFTEGYLLKIYWDLGKL